MVTPRPIKNSVEIVNGNGESISCDVRFSAGSGTLPVVIICHSFMAFKDWGFFPLVGERIAEEGFVTVSFNFSRNGVVGDGDRITDFNAFASNSFSAELEDLGSVVEAVRAGGLAAEAGDAGRIILLGHSRGGGVAISYASRDPGIAALATWSAISTFNRWTPHQLGTWKKNGYLVLGPPDSAAGLRLGRGVLEEIERRLPEIDPVLRAPYIGMPWQIVHGREDVTVPVREAEALFAAAPKGTRTVKYLDSVGHLYNARSEDEDHYMTINHVISLTVEWMRGVTR